MAECVKIWFDPEADYLEVIFCDAPGYMRETDHDAIMERVDMDGNLIGFSILAVSQLSQGKPMADGFDGMIRFLRQFKPGQGDYTAERQTYLKDFTLDQIFADIERSRDQT